MAHPDLLASGDAAEERIFMVKRGAEVELGETVFAAIAFLDLSSEEVRHQLLAIADSENGDAGGEQEGVDGGTAGIVDAGGSSGDDYAFYTSINPGKGGGGSLTGKDFGEDSEVAHFSRDEMTVLAAGVENGNLCGQFLS
jgi:hypothetical protein